MKNYIHHKRVKTILFSLIFFLLLLTSGYGEENKTVRVVCSIMDTSSTGYKSGYSYEYFQRIAYITGWKYEYVYADFSTALKMLENGEVDIKDNLSYTDERAELISYSEYPQGEEDYYLFTSVNNRDSLHENLENLNGKKVAVSKGSFQENAFKKWLIQHNINVEIIETSGSNATFEALNRGEVSGIVYPGTNDARGYVPVANIGHSDFYFGVSKKRPDTLNELNEALRKIQTLNPSFNDALYKKYESFDAASLILTEEEYEYANNLKEIKIGILDDYLPFSTEEKGEVKGVVTYIADCIKEMTSDSNNLQISYKTYSTYLDMIQGLKDKEVNIVFPVTSDFYYSTVSEMEDCIKFWLEEYQNQYYVRFSVINKADRKAIGTVEIFGGEAGVLRIDLSSKNNTEESFGEILKLAIEQFIDDFEIGSVKIKSSNIPEKINCLESFGFIHSKTYRTEFGYHEYNV